MEVSASDSPAPEVTAPAVKSVTFELPNEVVVEKETERLLPESGASTSINSTSGLQRAPSMVRPPSTSDFYSAPLPVLPTSRFELQPVPAVNEWPADSLRIACPHCGHFVETTPVEEMLFMGCGDCFSSRAVFRKANNHYCPNCSEPIGVHYTGEDCYWCSDSGKHTLTFTTLFMTCCGTYQP